MVNSKSRWEEISKKHYKKFHPWWHWFYSQLFPFRPRDERQEYGEPHIEVWYCEKCDVLYKIERDYFNKKLVRYYILERDPKTNKFMTTCH